MSEGDTLGDVALETFNGSLQEDLLAVINISERVEGLLGTVRLRFLLVFIYPCRVIGTRTPSSTGTEKKSQPVAFRTASPPGTPSR